MENKKKTRQQRVKDVIDFAYEYLIQHNDGITMNAKEIFGSDRDIFTVLVKRGIVKKTYVAASGRRGVICKYKWVATMPPTKNLYASISQELRDESAKYKTSSISKGLTPDMVVLEEAKEIPATVIEQVIEAKKQYVTQLDGFSDQQLWDELKKRGYSIEDNRLVIIKKAYLD